MVRLAQRPERFRQPVMRATLWLIDRCGAERRPDRRPAETTSRATWMVSPLAGCSADVCPTGAGLRAGRALASLLSIGAGAVLVALAGAARAESPAVDRLTGHGGPVRAISVSPDGREIVTSSFDNTVGVWDGKTLAHKRWLEPHDAAANAALHLPSGRAIISAGDDFKLRRWAPGSAARGAAASVVLQGHRGKVMGLAATSDDLLASAGWDGWVGLWSGVQNGEGDAPFFLTGHRAAVNDVAFARSGKTLYSASADGTVRAWRVADRQQLRIEAKHGFGINKLIVGPGDAWLAYGATDGVVRIVDPASGKQIAKFGGERRPILAMALSRDETKLAYGDGQGYITLIDVGAWRMERDFRAVRRGPVWALAFRDEDTLLAGGLDDFVSVWPIGADTLPRPAAAGDPRFLVDPKKVSNGERQFARKCSVCHTLTPDGRRRAGPTLYGLFGRRAGTLPGYTYSKALSASTIVWSSATVDKLFDLGPAHYTPGSKMPMQRITRPADRADLITYLQAVTAPAVSQQ
ncbi:MAG: c-type cytochrome [Pseudomonadota bacterium]